MRVLLLKPNTKPKSPHPHTLSPNCLYTAPQISSPTPTDFSSQLSKFTHLQNIKNGRKAHAQIIKTGCTSFPFLHNSLINMYAKCGQTYESLLIFESTQENNVISWTSAISAFVRGNMPYKAMSLFSRMRREGTQPNQFTLSAILPSCWELKNGVQIHSLACKNGFSSDVFVASALVDMYSKCLDMVGARKVFEEMGERNLVSWNTMVVGFSQSKIYGEAFGFFRGLLAEGIRPDQVTISSILSSCANTCSLWSGKQVHVLSIKLSLNSLPFVYNSLLDMYNKCRALEEAMQLFHSLRDRDAITWNVMIMGLAQNKSPEEACNYFCLMRTEGIQADDVSFSTVLYATAGLASLDQGTIIHSQAIKSGFHSNACVASSLITMYSKCGSMIDAYKVFSEMGSSRNVVSWTAVIAAHQQHGLGTRSIELFKEMIKDGVEPDYITYVCVLSACSHNGLIEQGFEFFDSMVRDHGLRPGHEHYACMVDLLGRVGRLEEAKQLIETMPIKPDSTVWGALLGACRIHGNLDIGKEAAEKLFKIEPKNPGNYVLLSNMYATKGRLDEANEVRRLMGVHGVRKEPGCSWIEFQNVTYVFNVHDRSHPKSDEIYEMLGRLEELVRERGYVVKMRFALDDMEEENKEHRLWYHSERLALAFGLISMPAPAPIRIKKNLRTCGDCHFVMKVASEIFKREIVVRDVNRFHLFKDGSCSCRDYW